MIRTILTAALVAMTAWPATAEEKPAATLYKNPQCNCCEDYARYLRKHGIAVNVEATHDLSPINRQLGVPSNLEGCHVTIIDGYAVGGHVPIKTINKLRTERPEIKGITLPGMPLGSPGMNGRKTGPFAIYEISSGASKVYAVE